MSKAITGQLEATLPDGTTITDSTDLGLAWKVAEHMAGPERWATMSLTEAYADVHDFLAMFREAYHGNDV